MSWMNRLTRLVPVTGFVQELVKFDTPELEPLGKQIIDCFMNGGTLEDFEKITPTGL